MNSGTRLSKPIKASTSPDDASVSDFLAEVDSQLNQSVGRIQVDCAHLTRVTSSHINALWLARDKCNHLSVALDLINVGHRLRRVLEALDLADLLLPESEVPYRFHMQLAATEQDIDSAMSRVVGFLTRSGVPTIMSASPQP